MLPGVAIFPQIGDFLTQLGNYWEFYKSGKKLERFAHALLWFLRLPIGVCNLTNTVQI